jgi:hypothetical protein
MNTDVTYAANEAIFGLQLRTNQAVNFVVRNAKVDKTTAKQALKAVMTGYKETTVNEKV